MFFKPTKRSKTIWIEALTPPFSDHFKIVNELDGNQLNSLIYGYIRLLVEDPYTIIIPNEIKPIILLFYHVKYSMSREDIFGATYQCQHKQTGKKYAVRILNKSIFYRIPYKYRWRYLRAMHDEIDTLRYTMHPNIIELHNVYEDKHSFHIVMQQCTGGQLFERIIEKGQYTENEAAKLIKQLLLALKYMHEENQIVHCDLKPSNILFLDKSSDSLIKILDFGMSKVLPRLQYLTHLCDTPYYTAPEVIKYKKYNHSCDMWSVGVICYVLIFGYPPFYVDPQKYGKHETKAIYNKIRRGFIARIRSTEKHGYGPWFPDHIPVSQEVRHLIGKLLEFKVRNRYTANEALQHPWIVNNEKQQIDQHKEKYVNTHQEKTLIQSLAKFSDICQFKLAVVKLFRQQFEKMRPKHFNELEQLFMKMDVDGDGIINYKEFENVVLNVEEINIKRKYIQQIFENIKMDGKGIKFNDLLNALVHEYLLSCDERLYVAFRQLDDDDDGKITTNQLKQTLKAMDPLDEWDKAIKLIEEISLDQNGVIDYEEFLLNLHPNFEESAEWIPDRFKNMSSFSIHEHT